MQLSKLEIQNETLLTHNSYMKYYFNCSIIEKLIKKFYKIKSAVYEIKAGTRIYIKGIPT